MIDGVIFNEDAVRSRVEVDNQWRVIRTRQCHLYHKYEVK